MQAYHNGDRYYQQPSAGYPQGYYQQFPGYGYPQPGPGAQPIAQPFPVYPGVAPSTPAAVGRPRPLDREPSRSSTPARPGLGKPLKSALKRTKPKRAGTPDGMPYPVTDIPRPVSRGRSTESIHRQRTRSGSRMRANSIPRMVPGTSPRTRARPRDEPHMQIGMASPRSARSSPPVSPIDQQAPP